MRVDDMVGRQDIGGIHTRFPVEPHGRQAEVAGAGTIDYGLWLSGASAVYDLCDPDHGDNVYGDTSQYSAGALLRDCARRQRRPLHAVQYGGRPVAVADAVYGANQQ